MKILVFGDNHGDMTSLESAKQKAEFVDLVICLGDLTFFGEDLDLLLKYVNTFPKKVIMMHGNHEDEEFVRIMSKKYKNIEFSHADIFHHGEYSFITYGGDGFSRANPHFEEIAKELIKESKNIHKTVIVLHGPPLGTKLDQPMEGYHSGSLSYREFLEEYQPLIAFAGHIHEGEKQKDYIGHVTVFNPGPDGEIIDLEVLHKERKKKLKEKSS